MATRKRLLENFDVEVAEKLNVYKAQTSCSLSRYESLLWDVSCYELSRETGEHLTAFGDFDERAMSFELVRSPESSIPIGLYRLGRQETAGHHYHLQHPLAEWVLAQSQSRSLPSKTLMFDYGAYGGNVAAIEPVIGKGGLLLAQRLSVQGLEAEDYIVVVAITDGGEALQPEQASALFKLPAKVQPLERPVVEASSERLTACYEAEKGRILESVSVRNAAFFEEEIEKLDRWAEDRRLSLKDELRQYDDDIAAKKKQAREARNLPEKLALQKQVSGLNKKRDAAWREYDRGALDVEAQKDALIESVAARLEQAIAEETLFTVRWRLVA
ncbi:MAG: hypothetical protein AAGL17_16535 [Cyanobacteria bacterium J06576_12]